MQLIEIERDSNYPSITIQGIKETDPDCTFYNDFIVGPHPSEKGSLNFNDVLSFPSNSCAGNATCNVIDVKTTSMMGDVYYLVEPRVIPYDLATKHYFTLRFVVGCWFPGNPNYKMLFDTVKMKKEYNVTQFT